MYLKFFLHQKDDVRGLFENHLITNAKPLRAAHNNTVQTQSGPGGREGQGERRRRQFRRIFRCSHSSSEKGLGGAILRSPQVIIPQRCIFSSTLAAPCHPSAGSLRQRIILRSFRALVDSQPANMGMNTWEQGIAASSHVMNARLGQAGNGPALTRVLRQRLTTPAGTGQKISKRWKSK